MFLKSRLLDGIGGVKYLRLRLNSKAMLIEAYIVVHLLWMLTGLDSKAIFWYL